MKIMALHLPVLAAALIIFSAATCAKFDDLDDQNPILIVDIEVTDPVAITINANQKVYLIYYTNSDWTNPWLQHGSSSATIINPVVLSKTLYIAAFWDDNGNGFPDPTDGNGVVDPGEPCTGWLDANHVLGDELTKLVLFPLEWRKITMTLDPAIVY